MKDETKTTRILSLYDALTRGRVVNRAAWAKEHGMSERSVQRDIADIQAYLDERNAGSGQNTEIKTDRVRAGYCIKNLDSEFLSEGELFGICKILIESRAFRKDALTSLLTRLLKSVMSDEAQARIAEQIRNELYNYCDPAHEAVSPDTLWSVVEAIRSSHVLEFKYKKMSAEEPVFRRVRPLGILFSEYYFYLMGIFNNKKGEETLEKNGPIAYRIDRISSLTDTGETFRMSYGKRFKEGEYKNHVQFMYGGAPTQITFKYYGPSIEAVLDRLPTAKAVCEENGAYTVRADVVGSGILMWLLSQGSKVEVLAPADLRNRWLGEIRAILERAEGKK